MNKENWERYYAVEMDNYRKVTETAYAGGTIVGILVMQRDYDLCKEWALELADICDMQGIG